MQKVFKTGQVAKIAGASSRTVAMWFDTGRLKGYRIPGSLDRRIPRENLILFLEEHGMPLGNLKEEELYKVLLVGVQAHLCGQLREHLPEDEDFKFECAGSGFAAGILAACFRPNAVILDLGLGRTDCIGIAENLGRIEAYEATMVLALTAEDETNPQALREAGCDDIFQNPFDPMLLAEKLRVHREELELD